MPAYTRILALSDINWSPNRQGTNVRELISLVEQVNPNLVMLAGDLVDNDKGGVRDKWIPYWEEVGKFLSFLEKSKVLCYFIQGNWDRKPEYDKLVSQSYSHIKEISERVVEINNIRTLGISHSSTDTLTSIKGIHKLYPAQVDIVLAHADGTRGRRVWLFELPAKLIITGHFDQKFCVVRGKIFLSFSNFPGQYAVIEYNPQEIFVNYFFGSTTYKAQIANGVVTWATEPKRDWQKYEEQIEMLLTFKEHERVLDPISKRDALTKLLERGIHKDHIRDYVPGIGSILNKQI